MKNIHILPTSQPSRLAYDFDKLILNSRLLSPILYKTQNIYITSDEKIKEGERGISINNSIYTHYDYLGKTYGKKIILTTDQDLIKDGVQAINDEFLEWFVKNPSCEEVEVEEFEPIYGHQNNSSNVLYKTIIPKEEQKQETLEEAVKNYCIKKYSVWVSNSDKSDDFINGAKWQQERMYSEEEVLKLVSDWTDYRMSEDSKSKVTFKKWFDKFKKK